MPNDFQAEMAPQGDTIADAALHMPDLEPFPGDEQPRNSQNGQYEEKPRRQAKTPAPLDPEEPATEALADDEPAGEESPVDEEYFEIAPEKPGDKPVRLKASEVWQRYQDYDRLQNEMDEVRKQNIAPQEWDQQILALTQMRGELMRNMQMQRSMIQPMEPDIELMNPSSQRYNPEAFYHQSRVAEQQRNELTRISHNMQQMQAEQDHQMSALNAAQMQRERGKLQQVWPELANKQEATRVRDELLRNYGRYGVDDGYIGRFDSAAFAIVKDALAYRRDQEARKAAVKVVRAKPKLVRAQGRDGTAPNSRRQAAAFQRLQQDGGSLDAAANALEGLL